ncbi:MAG: rhomboid family intramembrane serine protease [Myxococcales bacterium]|nr:rhomboid family intramembrane serine protease [Myxococcales bacterium]
MSDPLGGLEPAPVEEPRPEPPARKRPFTPTTWALLVVIGLGFLAEGIVGHDGTVESSVALIRLGALYLPAVKTGDWWRIGSYAFLHIGWAHIAMNGWALWILAPQLEATYGSNQTMGLFASTAIAGGGASFLWAIVRGGTPPLAAGASGGLFGLFGATVALAWRLRHRIPPEARRSVFRRILGTLAINVAIAAFFPVDSAAHLGGLLSGVGLGLVAPLPMLPAQPWHRLTHWLLIASALALFAGEGAAVAWAVKPKPRTLHGAGVEAQVPGMLVPEEPGLALLPGAAAVEIGRDDEPLSIEPGQDAIHVGERTWVREVESRDGKDVVRLAAADGPGRLVIEFACGADFCRGEKGRQMYELVARSIRTIH